MQNRIDVGMGEGVVTKVPHIISAFGLGSCVAVALYDTKQKIGGLAHIMLPDSESLNGSHPPYKCADTAIAALLDGLRSKGVVRRDVVAKIAGGALMFPSGEHLSTGIGEQNIMSVRHILKRERIPIVGEDTSGHHGRSVELHLDSGKLVVRVIGEEDKGI